MMDTQIVTTKDAAPPAPSPTPDTDGWQLAWQEDFESPELNKSDWGIVSAAPFKNNELQTYTDENVSLDNGCLKFTSTKAEDGSYLSGSVTTENRRLFHYGKIEIRAQLPSGQGIFPAFWMLPQSGDTLPEVDIIEYMGDETNTVWHVFHYMDGDTQCRSGTEFKGARFDQDFHTYTLEWQKDSLKWFVDGVETFAVNKNVPADKMYLILNTAVGGDWPGDPDSTTEFPKRC